MSDELTELQREWRNSVTESIKATEARTIQILEDLNSMRLAYVQQAHLESLVNKVGTIERTLSQRVSDLENSRSKLVGAAVILNLVGGIVVAVVLKLWK
jgi:hypothetical protein